MSTAPVLRNLRLSVSSPKRAGHGGAHPLSMQQGFWGWLSPAARRELWALRILRAYPKNAIVFMERQEAAGVYLICEGQVKLSMSSKDGKTLILTIAAAGDLLGLIGTLSGKSHEVSAVALRPARIAFIHGSDLKRFLARHPECDQAVIGQLGSAYESACEQIRSLGLAESVAERLARVLLSWSADAGKTPVVMPLTHAEIAELIGSTRETVTRTLSDFKNRKLIRLRGSMFAILNRQALQSRLIA